MTELTNEFLLFEGKTMFLPQDILRFYQVLQNISLNSARDFTY